ncbi:MULTISPECIES: DUF7336 domain-containing protein [Providencia]|nr:MULTISPECIES: hypothetical protein [Providencia]MBN4863922.1 hypothetical protein [Providencia stuartii]MBN4873244.1 hypothetical protein [Providencia stuartii]MBN4877635.1 hypothetical protein [Providencia stuartii]MBN4882445.1 hypothetical protein [Providencia stuartii]MBQ0366443.1 hypothetical protein [Providencia rettgeri]
MVTVYMLYHIRDEDTKDEDMKIIGIYSSFELAQKAQDKVSNQPGFIDYPDGFSISEEVLDRDGWVDGFVV